MANKQLPSLLPNLLLSTTYALNKSNSKRAIVGLELDEEEATFKPVIKLSGSGSPSKYVTLDMHAWELIVDQMDTMKNYLTSGYNASYQDFFGEPSLIMLRDHVINFTTSFKDKAICIVERSPSSAVSVATTAAQPSTVDADPAADAATTSQSAPSTVAEGDDNTRSGNEIASSSFTATTSSVTVAKVVDDIRTGDEKTEPSSTATTSSAAEQESTTPVTTQTPSPRPRKLFDTPQAPCKKRKFDDAPNIVMKLATFDGLISARECITLTMQRLKDDSIFVNSIYQYISNYIQIKLSDEDEESKRNTVRIPCKFFAFYDSHRYDMESQVENKMHTSMIDTDRVQAALAEIRAFYVPYIAQDLFLYCRK